MAAGIISRSVRSHRTPDGESLLRQSRVYPDVSGLRKNIKNILSALSELRSVGDPSDREKKIAFLACLP